MLTGPFLVAYRPPSFTHFSFTEKFKFISVFESGTVLDHSCSSFIKGLEEKKG